MSNSVYLNVAEVAGECVEANHKEWIDIFSVNWGASQQINNYRGGGGGAGKVDFKDLSVVAAIDNAMPTLMRMCATGQHIKDVKVSLCKAGGGKSVEYALFILKDALIADVSIGGSSGSQTLVTYKFQAAAIQIYYWKQMNNGVKGAEVAMGFDIKQNKVTG
ncbi:type VI secretion system tube protein Hcp [Mixta theicola]|uniref:Type VI secretion system tube protein Hcp n=1 Tax=Mixta theicola TaxID=1458355 RepID=A0A2K1Q7L7_9GAMM|nr:type VI secretion system tube protein Hcp [Mixta theicola]PNS11011.1 type VI secretion system tube protein Hcp [Mixta theicola]GLR08354.1 hypothetical protein GCM10007905_10730 [Mixta theicola]